MGRRKMVPRARKYRVTANQQAEDSRWEDPLAVAMQEDDRARNQARTMVDHQMMTMSRRVGGQAEEEGRRAEDQVAEVDHQAVDQVAAAEPEGKPRR